MSPASYRAAPPRVAEDKLTGWGWGNQIGSPTRLSVSKVGGEVMGEVLNLLG